MASVFKIRNKETREFWKTPNGKETWIEGRFAKNGKNNKNRQTHKQYILSRIKIDSKTGCWNWTKALIKGYARIGKKGEDSPLASRYVCKYLKGIDPKGNIVCHTCDNPKCVNPDHLFIGTTLDNFKQMQIKLEQ